MTTIWKLRGARQASFGIPTSSPTGWLTLRESFGEVELSVEVGEGIEPVEELADDATVEETWTALARLEEWISTTYASQTAAAEADRLTDDQEFGTSVVM